MTGRVAVTVVDDHDRPLTPTEVTCERLREDTSGELRLAPCSRPTDADSRTIEFATHARAVHVWIPLRYEEALPRLHLLRVHVGDRSSSFLVVGTEDITGTEFLGRDAGKRPRLVVRNELRPSRHIEVHPRMRVLLPKSSEEVPVRLVVAPGGRRGLRCKWMIEAGYVEDSGSCDVEAILPPGKEQEVFVFAFDPNGNYGTARRRVRPTARVR